jgi:hypothetical protein
MPSGFGPRWGYHIPPAVGALSRDECLLSASCHTPARPGAWTTAYGLMVPGFPCSQCDCQASGSMVSFRTERGSSPETMSAMVTCSRTWRRAARMATHTSRRCSADPS